MSKNQNPNQTKPVRKPLPLLKINKISSLCEEDSAERKTEEYIKTKYKRGKRVL